MPKEPKEPKKTKRPKKPKILANDFSDKLIRSASECEIETNPETKQTDEERFTSKIPREKGAEITDDMLRLFIEQMEREHEGDIDSVMEMYKGFGRPDKYGNMSRISTANAADMLGITPYELKRLAEYLEPNIAEIRDDTIKPWYKNIREAMGVDKPDEPKHR
jgi:hypothetical protein